jgi:hypothetical protein
MATLVLCGGMTSTSHVLQGQSPQQSHHNCSCRAAPAGCAVLASGAVSAKETEVTLLGDLAAFAAAVAVVAHWQAGKHLRTYQ